MSELKPCPSCNHGAAFYGVESYFVECCNCGMRTKRYRTAQEAVSVWNCRAQPANSRFADCHVWEPGDNLDTLSDKCEVLIKAADIKSIMTKPSNKEKGKYAMDTESKRIFDDLYALHDRYDEDPQHMICAEAADYIKNLYEMLEQSAQPANDPLTLGRFKKELVDWAYDCYFADPSDVDPEGMRKELAAELDEFIQEHARKPDRSEA